MLVSSWNEVIQTTVYNCFVKAGFHSQTTVSEDEQNENEQDVEVSKELLEID